MNARIQELAEQAGFTMRKFYGGEEYLTSPETPIESYCLDSELTKFTQLIVKECLELTLDYKNDDHYNGWLDYRDEIKQHFGVKE